MFCWSWLAGYLQRGLGIPPAGGMGRWRDEEVEKEEEESPSPCVCGSLTLTYIVAYRPLVGQRRCLFDDYEG